MTPLDLLHCSFTTLIVFITMIVFNSEFWPSDVSERFFDLFFFLMLAADWLTDY
jgi:hypothetical protein